MNNFNYQPNYPIDGVVAQEVSTVIPNDTFSIDAKAYENARNSLTMIVGGTEMMRVAPDGFYVRGVKVPVDEREAETVYRAFRQFPVWAEMNRR